MSSLIEGYNYDIFISYRQKDNKGDKWVSEFVEALKTELESTFKEEIGVYFDINPHDGLLETHDVDESLKEKLKCLIFIPIISRTYCDPKAFAWEHEFKAFVKQASKDQFGLKVKLPNGNVASRVLPVQIHDLDAEDNKTIESVLGAFMRSIEFIYREPGVDRPLTVKDSEVKNLNRTLYRNQINKVALAIKEITTAIKKPGHNPEEGYEKAGYTSILSDSITKSEKSIAVLPFINDSPDQENAYFINGIMEEILNKLQKVKDLRVISRTSVEKYRGHSKSISEIAQELGVNYIVEGSGQKYGNVFRLRTQLIAAERETHLWGESFQNEINDVRDIFSIQIKIAESIAARLKAVITPEERKLIEKIPTHDLTAYDLTLQAQKYYFDYYMSYGNRDAELEKVKQLCEAALKLDPGFAQAYYWLGKISLSDQYASGYPLPDFLDTALGFFNKAIELDPTLAEAYEGRGQYFAQKTQRQKAIDDLNKSIRLSPNNALAYLNLAIVYFTYSRDYVNALKNILKADELTKSDAIKAAVCVMMFRIYLSAGDLQKAEPYIQELKQLNIQWAELMEYWILEIQGKWEELLPETEKYIALYPEIADGYDYKARALLGLGRIEEAGDCIRIRLKYSGPELNNAHRVGIVLWMNGKRDEAMKYFNMQINNCHECIQSNNSYGQVGAAYDLAGVHAFLGNNEEAYRWLREYEKLGFDTGIHECIKFDPLFDNLRSDDEFKGIVTRASDKAAEIRAMINEFEVKGAL